MNKAAAAMCKLHQIADHHLLGTGSWPACGESVPAFFRTIRDLGLDEEVQATPGNTRSTQLGNEVLVNLMTVFAGCWDLSDIPSILADLGYISESDAEELWELPSDAEFERRLRFLVYRAYLDFCNHSELSN